eukprot:6847042-Ditylum_brightwellii.AAC.1
MQTGTQPGPSFPKRQKSTTIKNHFKVQEKEKKEKKEQYLNTCQEIHKNFTPFEVMAADETAGSGAHQEVAL